jgi:hypothetical protein
LAGGVISASCLATEGERLWVAVEGGLATVEAADAPLTDVLRAIGERAGIVVTIEGEAGERISRSLHDVPVSEAIGLLLRGVPSAVIYETSSGELAEIHVRLMGGGTSSAAAAPGAPIVSSAEPTEATSLSEGAAVSPDSPREDRIAFVRAAVRAPRETGIGELALLLRDDEDATVRAAAATGLGKLRGEEAGDALSLALADRDRTVRRAAARAFGVVGGRQAMEALERVLLEERASEVRRMAAYVLSRMSDETALSALEIARSDPDRTVRAIAETALSRDQD